MNKLQTHFSNKNWWNLFVGYNNLHDFNMILNIYINIGTRSFSEIATHDNYMLMLNASEE